MTTPHIAAITLLTNVMHSLIDQTDLSDESPAATAKMQISRGILMSIGLLLDPPTEDGGLDLLVYERLAMTYVATVLINQ